MRKLFTKLIDKQQYICGKKTSRYLSNTCYNNALFFYLLFQHKYEQQREQ